MGKYYAQYALSAFFQNVSLLYSSDCFSIDKSLAELLAALSVVQRLDCAGQVTLTKSGCE